MDDNDLYGMVPRWGNNDYEYNLFDSYDEKIFQTNIYPLPQIKEYTNLEYLINQNEESQVLQNSYSTEYVEFCLFCWLMEHQNYPYMNKQSKKNYAIKLNISVDQVTTYLNEQRKKLIHSSI